MFGAPPLLRQNSNCRIGYVRGGDRRRVGNISQIRIHGRRLIAQFRQRHATDIGQMRAAGEEQTEPD